MTVTIQIHQDRTVEDALFKVHTKTVYVSGISPSIFVHNTLTGEFEHVAYPSDMFDYPETREEATALDIPYYRAIESLASFTVADAAIKAAYYTVSRVKLLAEQYEKAVDVFVGQSDFTYIGA